MRAPASATSSTVGFAPARSGPRCPRRYSDGKPRALARSNDSASLVSPIMIVRPILDRPIPVFENLDRDRRPARHSTRRRRRGVIFRPVSCAPQGIGCCTVTTWCRRETSLRPESRDHLGHAFHHLRARQQGRAVAHQLGHVASVARAFDDRRADVSDRLRIVEADPGRAGARPATRR
jgi:hypothetical protein